MSLVVGVGGVLEQRAPWLWLGPLVGALGIVASVAAMREKGRWTGWRIWAVIAVVLGIDVALMTGMWGS